MKLLKKYKYIIAIIGCFVVILGMYILKKYNPEEENFFPSCMVYKLTGFQCAGCGMTRAVHYFLNFEFYKAFKFNPLLYLIILYLIYFFVIFVLNKFKIIKQARLFISAPLHVFLVITVLFMIIRNLV